MTRKVYWTVMVVLAASLGAAACAGGGERPETSRNSRETVGQISIGTATMLPDGTIVLNLRAGTGPSEPKGDARLSYPPGHPDYRDILDHVGGLRPGETRNVPPWTDE